MEMKHVATFESFKKLYMQKITPAEFKAIKPGKKLLYLGSEWMVVSNNGYVMDLQRGGDRITVNLNQFNHGAQINERKNTPVAKAQGIIRRLYNADQLMPGYSQDQAVTQVAQVLQDYKKMTPKQTLSVVTDVRKSLDEIGILSNALLPADVELSILSALTESKSLISEDLRSELKNYIKKHKREIDQLADSGDWERIYQKLISDFGVNPASEDAKELKTIFNIVY
jgi:hypothetical protein